MYVVSVATIRIYKYPSGVVDDIGIDRNVTSLEIKSFEDLRTFYDLLPGNSYMFVNMDDEAEVEVPSVICKPGDDVFPAKRIWDQAMFR